MDETILIKPYFEEKAISIQLYHAEAAKLPSCFVLTPVSVEAGLLLGDLAAAVNFVPSIRTNACS